MNAENHKIRFKSHCIVGLFLVAFVAAAVYLTGNSEAILKEQDSQKENLLTLNEDRETRKERDDDDVVVVTGNETAVSRCDFFSGRWVYDDVWRPLYKEASCSFMRDDYACEKFGRKDLEYQKWRWQPHHCDLPRFNGTALLEKIRGKKVVFVGDSLNKNQWTSFLCLIDSSLKSLDRSVTLIDSLFTFKAMEYNATIEFYWSPFLVESNGDNIKNHRVIRDRIVRIESIEKHARHWTDADVLIFDSFLWWLKPTMTLLWGSFGSPDAIYKRVEMKLRSYEMALTTWSDCGDTWEHKSNCYNETQPYLNESYCGVSTDREMMQVVESTLQKLEKRGLNVTYLNITRLSEYRKDAHPSIYRRFYRTLSKKKLSNPKSYSDCAHWCLPGVPNVWNEILYSYIIDL